MPLPTLVAGLTGTFRYQVGPDRTVPAIFPDAPDFQLMPAVLATGYMVALCEWAAIALIKPHLEWPQEQSLGTAVHLSHLAATPPGMVVTIAVRLSQVDGRRLLFDIEARDERDLISQGTHERHLILRERFLEKVSRKATTLQAEAVSVSNVQSPLLDGR